MNPKASDRRITAVARELACEVFAAGIIYGGNYHVTADHARRLADALDRAAEREGFAAGVPASVPLRRELEAWVSVALHDLRTRARASHAVLARARETLAAESAWLHGALAWAAATMDGRGCDAGHVDAVRWSIDGALERAAQGAEPDDAFALLCEVLGLSCTPSYWLALVNWQSEPTTTHADVLAAIDLALELARTRGGL